MLTTDVEQVPRDAGRGTEVAVVEDDDVGPGRGEPLGVGVQAHLLDPGQAVGHDDAEAQRRLVRAMEPSAHQSSLRPQRFST